MANGNDERKKIERSPSRRREDNNGDVCCARCCI